MINDISVYLYVYTQKYLVCEVLEWYVLLHIVCCDSRWKLQKCGITDSTCPSAFLAWEHQQQYLLDIDYIVTEHQNNNSSPDFV